MKFNGAEVLISKALSIIYDSYVRAWIRDNSNSMTSMFLSCQLDQALVVDMW